MPIPSTLEITAATVDPALLDLPWDIPLEEWPTEILAALPRGISRHVVRFVNLSDRVIAVKEIGESVAYREYELLRDLSRLPSQFSWFVFISSASIGAMFLFQTRFSVATPDPSPHTSLTQKLAKSILLLPKASVSTTLIWHGRISSAN